MADQSNNSDNAQVVVYSTTRCAFCNTEKQWLDHLGVSYVSKNIEEDDAANTELLEKMNGQYQGVQTTTIGEEVIVGFDRPKLTAALEKYNLLANA